VIIMMGRLGRMTVLVVLVLLAAPARTHAQLDCGGFSTTNRIYQAPDYARYVEVIAQTTRSWNLCVFVDVQVEAWVRGVGDAHVHRGLYTAEVYLGRSVPSYGRWSSESKHWAIWNGGIFGHHWEYLGTGGDETDVIPPPVQRPPTPEEECWAAGGTWNYEYGSCEWINCPVILDVAGNGYRLTSAAEGVRFDLDADGLPEQVAWTRAESDDAFLVMDRNGNGRIDDGTELFGNHTPAYADNAAPTTADGFTALVFLEGPGYGAGSADLQLDALDAAYARLMLWTDRNHNGLSEPDELASVSSAGLAALSTEAKDSRRRDRYGNEFRLRAPVFWRTESGVLTPRYAYDVWLRSR
jgi:hypothetical protein